jgi:hypothetical protein
MMQFFSMCKNVYEYKLWSRIIKTKKNEERLSSIKQICKKAYQQNRMGLNKENLSGKKTWERTKDRGRGGC